VLSFPIGLRILFAALPELLAPVLQIIHRVIAKFLSLVLDGLYRVGAEGAPAFHPAPALISEKLQALLGKIIHARAAAVDPPRASGRRRGPDLCGGCARNR
jgi:hypothetical protein